MGKLKRVAASSHPDGWDISVSAAMRLSCVAVG